MEKNTKEMKNVSDDVLEEASGASRKELEKFTSE
jgi:hypothetical protein